MPKDLQEKAASLSDLLNYDPEKYLSDDEVALIRGTFKGNKRLFNVLRKMFLPTISDPELPLESLQLDVYLQGVDWSTMSAEHVKAVLQGRQEAVRMVMNGLIKLKVFSNDSVESPVQMAARREKDSAK